MKRVTGLGGVFFKAEDPEALARWYEQHLGLPREPWGPASVFHWRDEQGRDGQTLWAPFKRDTKYFGPGDQRAMLNYRVEDLEAVLAALAAEGVQVLPEREVSEQGRFGWIVDLEGNRVELWEPPKPK